MSDMEFLDDSDLEALEAVDDGEASDDEDYDEARRRRRGRPVTARGRGYTRPRLAEGYVTQAQFQAGVSRIGKDIRRNAAGIKALSARIDSALDKQDKAAASMKSELARTRELSMITPLLLAPKTITTGGDVMDSKNTVAIPAGTKLNVTTGDTLTSLLPLLLLGGGLGGSGGGSSGGMDSTMMMVLALTLLK